MDEFVKKPRGRAIKKKGLYGVATNDVDYQVYYKSGDKCIRYPVFYTWQHILGHCFCPHFKASRPPGHVDNEIAEEWLLFSNFAKWMESQDWKGRYLRRDRSNGNKLYSPATCRFVDAPSKQEEEVSSFTSEPSVATWAAWGYLK